MERDILVEVNHPFIVKLHYGKFFLKLLGISATMTYVFAIYTYNPDPISMETKYSKKFPICYIPTSLLAKLCIKVGTI